MKPFPTCSFCHRPVFTVINGNQGYRCKACFSEWIESKVRKAIAKYDMIKYGQRVGIGFSGGKDSTVLLSILAKLEEKKPRNELVALTIDEGIAGYREESRQLVNELINQLNIEHHSVTFEELYGHSLDELVQKNRSGLGGCAICGPLRRNALNKLARDTKVDVLATGHNLDDEAQTILMNVVRGDYNRLTRNTRKPVQIHKAFVPRVKPLVYVNEREIVLYLFANNLNYQDINCPYADSSRRNSVRDFLLKEENNHAGTLKSILNVHDKLLSEMDLIEINASDDAQLSLNNCIKCSEPTEGELCSVCTIFRKIL